MAFKYCPRDGTEGSIAKSDVMGTTVFTWRRSGLFSWIQILESSWSCLGFSCLRATVKRSGEKVDGVGPPCMVLRVLASGPAIYSVIVAPQKSGVDRNEAVTAVSNLSWKGTSFTSPIGRCCQAPAPAQALVQHSGPSKLMVESEE